MPTENAIQPLYAVLGVPQSLGELTTLTVVAGGPSWFELGFDPIELASEKVDYIFMFSGDFHDWGHLLLDTYVDAEDGVGKVLRKGIIDVETRAELFKKGVMGYHLGAMITISPALRPGTIWYVSQTEPYHMVAVNVQP